jgi:hypothetical protein
VAAHHEYSQCVVLVGPLRRRLEQDPLELAIRSRVVAATLIDQAATGGAGQPAARVGRDALCRPVTSRRDERFLDGVVGRVEVARAARKCAEDLWCQLAQQVLDGRRGVQRVAPPAV